MTETLIPIAPSVGKTGSVICTRAELVEILTIIAGVMKQRTPRAVLQCVRLTTSDNALAMSGTNLQAWVVSRALKNQVEAAFDTAVPCERLLDILNAMSEETVTLKITGTELQVRGNNGTFKIPTQSVDELPPEPHDDEEASVELSADAFARLARQALPCVGKPGSGVTSGLLITVDASGKVSFVSTEGHVLAIATASGTGTTGAFNMVVPPDAVRLAERAAGDSVRIAKAGPVALFHAGETRIMSTQLEGEFPAYAGIVPTEKNYTLTVAREELSTAVRQTSIIAKSDETRPALRFTIAPGTGIGILARNAEGEADVTLPCKVEGGEPMEIGLNADYLMAGLSVMESAELTIEMTVPSRPPLFRDGAEFLFLAMPINLA